MNITESIGELRTSVNKFTNSIVIPQSKGDVLEIGPEQIEGSLFPNLYVNIGKAIRDRGLPYTSLDIYPFEGVTLVGDMLSIPTIFKARKFDTIIMLEVIEHVHRFWEVPEILYNALNPEGLLFLSTPFYFMLHDPRPDYWRLSADGLAYIFAPYFNVQIVGHPAEGNFTPHHTLIGKKR